jgi:hypothetical protein
MTLGMVYCGGSLVAAWRDDMAAVADLPEWNEVITRNPGNRDRILGQDRKQFVATMERWMHAYCPHEGEMIPGLPDADVRKMNLPTLVFRSGESDAYHTRETSERLAAMIPTAQLVEPPWGDREWTERQFSIPDGGSLFDNWPRLAPSLVEWADRNIKA